MNKEENMEIRTLETFVKGVKEEGASEPCKYVQFNRQEAQRLLDYIVELQDRIDEAIEYIENEETYEEGYCDGKLMIYKDRLEYELLNILRGENNE